MMGVVRVFTDGSCLSNPGPGGWAAVFSVEDGELQVLTGNELSTTNNRMELKAVIEAFRKILSGKVKDVADDTVYEVYSDSAYVVNAICKRWFKNWEFQGWRKGNGESIKNPDLWEEFARLSAMANAAKIRITVFKVKGHAGNPLNEMADELAVKESNKAKKRSKELA